MALPAVLPIADCGLEQLIEALTDADPHELDALVLDLAWLVLQAASDKVSAVIVTDPLKVNLSAGEAQERIVLHDLATHEPSAWARDLAARARAEAGA